MFVSFDLVARPSARPAASASALLFFPVCGFSPRAIVVALAMTKMLATLPRVASCGA
jgi:hypothetical protein